MQRLFSSLMLLALICVNACTLGTKESPLVEFKIDTHEWLTEAPQQKELTSHYGVLVVDVMEKQKTFENLGIQPLDPISFTLKRHHTYYILLIAYDDNNQVLSFAEKELKI